MTLFTTKMFLKREQVAAGKKRGDRPVRNVSKIQEKAWK
jgi:hypothetical protein